MVFSNLRDVLEQFIFIDLLLYIINFFPYINYFFINS